VSLQDLALTALQNKIQYYDDLLLLHLLCKTGRALLVQKEKKLRKFTHPQDIG